MKNECSIVQDILPLYVEDMVSEDTAGFVKEHLRGCPECRAAFRAQNGGARPQREMFTAICADCGKETQVPFQPRGDKPVYCRDCFANHRQPRY